MPGDRLVTVRTRAEHGGVVVTLDSFAVVMGKCAITAIVGRVEGETAGLAIFPKHVSIADETGRGYPVDRSSPRSEIGGKIWYRWAIRCPEEGVRRLDVTIEAVTELVPAPPPARVRPVPIPGPWRFSILL